jgi:competence protein ComEC
MDVVDVGTGLGIVVRGPDFTLVYDGGSNDDLARGAANRLLAYLKAVVPSLTTIDHLILSHPHRDHVELLPDLFAEYQVRDVWDSGRLHDICGYRAFITAVRDEPGVSHHSATQDFGTRDFPFAAKNCYGESLAAETLHIAHASRINEFPVPLGQGASMTFLHADGSPHSSPNENSLVVRLDLGDTRVLLMGDAEAGGRQSPAVPPTAQSIEGRLMACCASQLPAQILVVGHHGSKTSSRKLFLDAVGASIAIVSSGPRQYGSVVLPDPEVIAELTSHGQVFRTDVNDQACQQNPAKIGPDTDGRPGGCDNIRVVISPAGPPQVGPWHGAETP